jgi:hypothetical protein
MRASLVALGAVLLVSPMLEARAQAVAPAIRLTPHRAVYDLSLLRTAGKSSMERARGRIAFDFGGDACDGYTLQYRQVTVLENSEGMSRTLDVRSTTFEAGDGKFLRFKTETQTRGASGDQVDGEADRRPDGTLAVRLKQPKRENVTLPGEPVFPNEHMRRLIEAARAGQSSMAVKVYDGSDSGKKVYDTYAVVGRRIEPGAGANLEEPARQDGLAKLARWPVSISYYETETGDQTPAYTISFEVYENGISRALKLDYGDFALKGDLQALTVAADSACQR